MIGSIIEENPNVIRVYDETGRELSYMYINKGNGDYLQGYTSTTFNIVQDRGKVLRTYDETCRELSYRYL